MLSGNIEEGKESYEFTWPGKKESMAEAHRPTRMTLRPATEESLYWATTKNIYIEGDNLEVLKLLQESYLEKVDLIYIDPPYNTGHDFIYPDNYKMSDERYNNISQYYNEDGNINFTRENSGSSPKYHSDWCSMIYPRLILGRNLLSERGIIVISIDENEIANMRKICDEVFGDSRFVAQITLLCNPKGRSQDKYVANCHEYLLIYSKTTLDKGSLSIPKTDEEIAGDYILSDEGGPFRELELRNTHREFGKFNRPNLWYPIYVNDRGEVFLNSQPNAQEVFPIWEDGFEGCWTWGKEKAYENSSLLSAKKVKGYWKIYRKSYAYDGENKPLKMVKSIWNDKSFFTEKGQKAFDLLFDEKNKLFQSPKSVDLIKQCIQMSRKRDAIILDFFGGSSTTAQAVVEMNKEDNGTRSFILIQLPIEVDENSQAYKSGFKKISDLGKERIRRVAKYLDNCKVDTGFRVFKVSSSNMKNIYYSLDDYDQNLLSFLESNVKEDRTDLDLLFGCLIDWGLEITKPHFIETIGGCSIHSYDGEALIACFNESIPEVVVREIASRQPLRAVFRDSGFENDAARVNVAEIFKLLSPDTEVKVI